MISNASRLIKKDILRIALPSFLAILLLSALFFSLFLPKLRNDLVAERKKMLSNLVQSALGIVSQQEKLWREGKLSLIAAQEQAKEHIRGLRYGPDDKDYFWINDMHPKMLVHPYRRDLEEKDVGSFTDPSGKYLFREMVTIAKSSGSGYTEYQWQWKDNSTRIVPKLSYVKFFQPWGWIIGTGVYLEDVHEEISSVMKEMALLSGGVLLLVAVFSVLMIRKSSDEIKRRMLAEAELNAYKDNLEKLVEKRTEELKFAQTEVKTLSGLIPVCSYCKKIRDDRGYWEEVTSYITKHSDALFSHGMCPDCGKKALEELESPKKQQ